MAIVLTTRQADLSFDDRDSAPYAPLATVIDPAFTWGDDRPPRTPWHKTVIYELHVKGFTQKNPEVPEKLRGSYAGLASESAIKHLTDLGVTAVELLPVHYHLDDRHLTEKGLKNYWGYNTLGFLAPEPDYCCTSIPQDNVQQFKMMVRAMHAAGLEVILDVVYNHTAEGNQMGPTLSMRGVDNAAYYRLAADPRYYMDFTGTGNTLNMTNPHVLQLIMDSLRYWVTEMHVDGFRFDLASTLARELFDVNRLGAFFDIIHQDPILSQVKLIAEPWDVGPGRLSGRQLPGALDGVERQVPRLRAPVLERGRRDDVRAGDAPGRQQRPVPGRWPQAVRQHQFHHLSRRVHAGRPGQLQRKAQRRQRRGKPRRRQRQQ